MTRYALAVKASTLKTPEPKQKEFLSLRHAEDEAVRISTMRGVQFVVITMVTEQHIGVWRNGAKSI